MGELPEDYLDLELAIKLGMDPDELDKKPLAKVELWQRYFAEIKYKERLDSIRKTQANGQ